MLCTLSPARRPPPPAAAEERKESRNVVCWKMDTSSFGRWMFHARENPASSKDWHCTKGDIFFLLLLFIKVPRTYELSALLEAHSFRHWVCQGTMWSDEEKACPCSPKKLVKDFFSLSFSYATPQPNLRLSSIYIIIFLFKAPFPSLFLSVDSMVSESCYSTGNSVLLDFTYICICLCGGAPSAAHCSFLGCLFPLSLPKQQSCSNYTIIMPPNIALACPPRMNTLGFSRCVGVDMILFIAVHPILHFAPFFLFFWSTMLSCQRPAAPRDKVIFSDHHFHPICLLLRILLVLVRCWWCLFFIIELNFWGYCI